MGQENSPESRLRRAKPQGDAEVSATVASDVEQTIGAPSQREFPGATAGPTVAQSIDRFEIIRKIGQGGMADVFLARHPVTGLEVAVKQLKPELVGDRRQVQQFLTEARHMYHLNHPHILRIMEVWDPPAGPYYVMPFMDCGSLAQQIRPGQPTDYVLTLRAARQIADAMVHAHRKGIIHRDLKPLNVLLDNKGNAFLSDFGLVRAFNTHDPELDVRQSQMLGTVPYMSPAVAQGEAEDTRCDIYAFGAMLYELLTGYTPYEGKTAAEVLEKILASPPIAVLRRNPHAPPGLAAIAAGAMARQLRDRYSTMADVLADLQRVERGQKPLGPHGGERGSRSPGVGKRWAWAAVAIAAVVVAAIPAVRHFLPRVGQPSAMADAGANAPAASAAVDSTHAAAMSPANAGGAAALSPVAQSASPWAPLAPDPGLAVLPKEPGLVATLDGHSKCVKALRFLSGGKLVSRSDDGTVRIWDVVAQKEIQRLDEGGFASVWPAQSTRFVVNGVLWDISDVRKLATVPGPVEACSAATADATKFVFRAEDGSMTEYEPARGTRILLFPSAAGDVAGDFAADGTLFLHCGDNELRIYSINGWKELARFNGSDHGLAHISGRLSPDGSRVVVGNDEENKASAMIWEWKTGRQTPLRKGARHVWTTDPWGWSPRGRFVSVDDWDHPSINDATSGRRLFQDQNGSACSTSDDRGVVVVGETTAELFDVDKLGSPTTLDVQEKDGNRVICVSPDRRFIAVARMKWWETNPTPIHVYRLPEQMATPAAETPAQAKPPALVQTLVGHTKWVNALRFLPGGKLVSGSTDSTIRVWDLAGQKEILRIEDGGFWPGWPANSTRFVVNGALWDVSEGRKLATVPGPVESCSAATADATKFVFHAGDGSMTEYEPSRGTCIPLFPAVAGDVAGEFSADGTSFLYCGGNELRIYGVNGWSELARFRGSEHGLAHISGRLSPEGSRVIIGDNEEHKASAMIWEWKTGHQTPLLNGARQVWIVDPWGWSPRGRFVSVDDWGDKFVYDSSSGQRAFQVLDKNGEAGLCFTPDDRWAIRIGSKMGGIFEVDKPGSPDTFKVVEEKQGGRVLCVSPDRRFVAVALKAWQAVRTPIHIYRLPERIGTGSAEAPAAAPATGPQSQPTTAPAR